MGVVFGKRRDPDVHRAHVRERLRLEILHKAQQFAQTRDERSQRVLDACSGAAEHIFPYAAVHMVRNAPPLNHSSHNHHRHHHHHTTL